ncbi:hypothetical protein ACMFMG_011581 [Clarireedia jacksonii]
MVRKLELRTLLRKEVSKSILKIPLRRQRPRQQQDNPSVVSLAVVAPTDSYETTFRGLFPDGEKDFETPVEKPIHADTDIISSKRFSSKEKSEIRIQIENLQEQLLEVIARSHESSGSRAQAVRERGRLIRRIEVLEAKEKVQRENALRATGNLPEPLSGGEKKHIQQEIERAQKALERKVSTKPLRKRPLDDALADQDPDGETRHQLGMSLKRRKIEYTGRWVTEVRPKWPELRYQTYGMQRVRGLLLAGAGEEQKKWIERWLRGLDRGKAKGKAVEVVR